MARYEVTVILTVNADSQEEAFAMAESTVSNLTGGEVVDAFVDGVMDADDEAFSKEEEYLYIAAELNKD